MKNNENIEEWYRDELNKYSVEPDINGWSSLSGDLDATSPLTDDTISEWYKKEVYKLEERPDFTVWDKLSSQLDTASVWDKLTVSLYKYDQLIWWKNLAIKGSAILLLLFGSLLALDNNFISDNTFVSNRSGQTESENFKATEVLKTFEKQNNTQNKHNISAVVSQNNNNKINTGTIKTNNQTSEKMISNEVNNAKTTLLAQISTKKDLVKNNKLYVSINKLTKTESISITHLDELKTNNDRTIFTKIKTPYQLELDYKKLVIDGEYLVKKNNDKIVFNNKRFNTISMFGIYARRFYVGFNIGIKKQGMISTLKENSRIAIYSHNVLPDFGNSFGGTVGYILSDNINLEANVNLNSTAGYKKTLNTEGVSYQENLNLNYTTINLLAKKMNTKSTFDNKVYSTNFIGGVYASYLRSSVSDIDGATINLDGFNSTDYGIVLGIEQDRYITKTLVITPGIRYNQGVSDITNNKNSLQTARNFSLEFNLGVKYIFLKKGK